MRTCELCKAFMCQERGKNDVWMVHRETGYDTRYYIPDLEHCSTRRKKLEIKKLQEEGRQNG